eukprot:FR744415.1.p1 GENE.FR744415.1~~FR744415.1.p1  ORF type:complete len:379 (+),score=83.94 FR744415.1:137-1138(+)
MNQDTQKHETSVLVRESANGTAKWGVGTGVPSTRWMLSAQDSPPLGYKRSEPPVRFAAENFPTFPRGEGQKSWTYDKIDICESAFSGGYEDPELEECAKKVRAGVKATLAAQVPADRWEAERLSIVRNVIDSANSVAAIQGALRMSGLFARKGKTGASADESVGPRYVELGGDAPDHAELAQSMRIFTMFPQMPFPLPDPSTSPEELEKEIRTRDSRMAGARQRPAQGRARQDIHAQIDLQRQHPIPWVFLPLGCPRTPGSGDKCLAFNLFGDRENRAKMDFPSRNSKGSKPNGGPPSAPKGNKTQNFFFGIFLGGAAGAKGGGGSFFISPPP